MPNLLDQMTQGVKRAFLEVFFMSAFGKNTVKQQAYVSLPKGKGKAQCR